MSLIVQSLNWVFISQSCSTSGSRRVKSASLSSRKSVACSTIPGGYRFACAPDGRKESAFSARQAENDRQGSCRRAGVIFRNGKLKEVALEKCGLLARKGRIGIRLEAALK